MGLIVAGILLLLVLIVLGIYQVRVRARRLLALHSIEPKALHKLLGMKPNLLVLDVRLPLDLLAKPEAIPGSTRIAPQEVPQWVDDLPRDREIVFYCTCPSDESSRAALHKALDRNFTHVKILRGGLAGWKQLGYAVEPYDEVFHLDTPT